MADDKEKMQPGSVLIALAGLRNTEAQLRWQGAQWVLALNVSAVAGVMYRLISKSDMAEYFVLSLGCAIIAFLDLEWYSVLRRDGLLLDFWNRAIAELERNTRIDGGMRIFSSEEYQRLARSRRRLQRTLERLTVGFIFTWSAMSIALCTWAFSLVLSTAGGAK